MACAIIEGYKLDCFDGIPGVQAIWLTEFDNITAYTDTSGSITAITQAASTKFWKFSLEKENAMLKQDMTVSEETGTSFVAQTLEFTTKKMTAKNRNIIKLLSQNRLMAIVQLGDSTANYVVAGLTRALTVTTVNTQTGQKLGELVGSKLTLMGKEPVEAQFMSSAIFTGLTTGQ